MASPIMTSPVLDANASLATSGMISPRHVRSRTQSISSDRPSTIGFGLVLPPLQVSPEACFIAHSAASQIITNDHDSHADAWYDQNGIEPATETAMVSSPALQLVNGFLDQLLFNFLQLSKSTNLSALRPAVVEVLKPKLAKDAISNADEELKEYLGGGNEEDYVKPQGSNVSRSWDLELVWKRTRLRCMVYSSLGDMEEEDEDLYMEEENLEIGAHEQISDVISPAVAIFLTSVLEYMGELTLTVAGQASYHRIRTKIEKELKEGSRDASDPADGIVVTDADMERVALDRTLGRLWRGWKKRMRTPATDIATRQFSKGLSTLSRQEHTTPGHDILGLPKSASSEHGNEYRKSMELVGPPIVEDVQAADIPLPIKDNDVEEIEVPGLAHYSDDEADDELDEEEQRILKRPKSLLLTSSIITNGLPTPIKSRPHTPLTATRKRSMSLPTPAIPHFYPKSQKPSEASAAGLMTDEEASATTSDAKQPNVGEKTSEKKAKQLVSENQEETSNSQSDESEYDDAEEVAFEKAEIMTSSRVSVSGSSHSNDSDNHAKSSPVKRSPSVQSARIIDVPASKSPSPRSPAHSRPGSYDTTERIRPVSLSGVSVASALARVAADDRMKTAGHKQAPGQTPGVSRDKGPVKNTASILEFDEGDSQRLNKIPGQLQPSPEVTSLPTAGSVGTPAQGRRRRGPPVTVNTETQTHVYDQPPISARAVPLPVTPATSAVEGERVPELPRKAPGHANRHSPKNESKGLLAIERTRTRESDEVSLPLQGNTSTLPAHTAASSVSSGASRLKPVRTSEDGSSRSEAVARNFEQLIQSNQTISYTLTPENMRDIDSKSSMDGPVVTKFARRKSEDVRAYSSPKSSPIVAQSSMGRLPSPRLPPAPASPKVAESKPVSNKPSGPVPKAPTGLAVSTGREGGPLARDARVPADTVTDFAEFIKSTGPPDETKSQAVPVLASPISPGGKSIRDSRRASATSSINRLRYQPRDATVDSRAESSDLIDFIRQGPPIAPSHRIPRHVAPFRTTMDSDQMSGAIGGKAVDANIPDIRNSQGSTNITESSMPSMHSSVNSKSALLRNKAGAVPNKMFGDEDMMPKRKTRRVRDPYAIDFSDEEEEEEDDEHAVETPRLPVKKEESLAEFLRNYEPPPDPVSPPNPRLPKKKASAPSLIGRFTRGTKDKDRDSVSIKGPPEVRSVHSRASGRGYIPIQVNMPPGYDMYGPIENTGSAIRTRGASIASSTAARIPMKKFEPREPVANRSQTAELAAFLRDSAPPPNNAPLAIDRAPSRQEESGGISRMFGRRKKPLAV
ncbi:hypothetical protein QQS21_007165 [Conoideocrella luteorostrata]|uniref:Flo11 n=1 Tax=Conoideocrella luteorostrata TaxID=1105319 RepID=A0AAJ0FXA8_9HYPO|nr:hypothetical protein QQS21_007165 [Conoideocrella luteorostrata]